MSIQMSQLGVASTRPIVAEENVANTGIDVAIFQIPLLPGTKKMSRWKVVQLLYANAIAEYQDSTQRPTQRCEANLCFDFVCDLEIAYKHMAKCHLNATIAAISENWTSFVPMYVFWHAQTAPWACAVVRTNVDENE